jgi:phytoene dehydrogenase-like protein
MLTAALATRLRADGGTVRCGDPVTEITGGAGGASGVRTKSGATIGARVVVAGCDVLTTVDLAAGLLPAALVARAHDTIRVGNGIGMVARLATAGLPRYPDADAAVYSALQLVVPSRAALRRAHADFASGRAPAEPAVLAMTFSALDRTLAPTGEHNVTLWGQWHPFELADECWGDIGARETDKMIAAVERVAPGFTDTVRDAFVQTPADLAAELALPRGNVMHVEMSLDAMFAWRPLPELAGYRTPVENLYLTGASTHPGGGVSGASGRNTAHVVLRDLQRRSRRRRLARAAHPRRAKDERRA